MIYVADTHALIWWMTKARPLGKAATRVFRRAERGLDEIRVSAVSVFELALLVGRGRLKSPIGFEGWLAALESAQGLSVEPFGVRDAAVTRGLSPLVDPFDCMIVATAIRLGAPLLTRDERITVSKLVAVVW